MKASRTDSQAGERPRIPETGKQTKVSIAWREAARLPGSGQVRHARTLLTAFDWWKLEPRRDAFRVGGQPNPLPTRNDLAPPHAAFLSDGTWVIYVPRGNSQRPLALEGVGDPKSSARWFNPRTGEFLADTLILGSSTLPPLPAPAYEDWVLVVSPPSNQPRPM